MRDLNRRTCFAIWLILVRMKSRSTKKRQRERKESSPAPEPERFEETRTSDSLTFSICEDFLCIRIDGKWPSGKPVDFVNSIYKLWEAQAKRKLLIDIRHMDDTPSVLSDFWDAKIFAEAGFCRVGKVSILDNLDRQKMNAFFETTASNRGLQFRFFYDDEQEALAWLSLAKERQTGST